MRERSFAPTVLIGLAGAGLAAVGAGREWARASGDAAGAPVTATVDGPDAAPLVLALALVALAGWGVVLVLRGSARRVAAVLGLLASAGALVALVPGSSAARDAAATAALAEGATGGIVVSGPTGWYWLTAAAAIATFLALAVAVRKAPRWPAMGSRYDAPAARAAAPVTDQDLWRALDEGHDPTA